MEAGVIHPLADLVALKAQDRQVDRTVAEVVAVGEGPVIGADELEIHPTIIWELRPGRGGCTSV